MATYFYTFPDGSFLSFTVNPGLDNSPTFSVGERFNFRITFQGASAAGVGIKATIHAIVNGTSYTIASFGLDGSGKLHGGSGSGDIPAGCCRTNTITGADLPAAFRVSISGYNVYHIFSEQPFYIHDTTTAPVFTFTESMLVDTTGAKDRFGYMVQNNSDFELTIPLADISTGDNITGSGRVTKAALKVTDPDGDTVFNETQSIIATDSEISFAASKIFTAAGRYTFNLSVTGYYGKTERTTVIVEALAYAPPSLSQNGSDEIAKRFRLETGNSGEDTYIDAVDGESVLLSFVGSIQGLDGPNTYSLIARYGEENAETLESAVIASGTDTDALIYTYQSTAGILPNTFSVKNSYRIEIVLTDWFGNQATLTTYVEKAIPDYSHDANGFAVGMYTTGTEDDKRFEVAENYTAHLYGETFAHGGISGVTNYVAGVEELTGGRWIDGKPIYRRYFTKGISSSSSGVTVGTITNIGRLIDLHGSLVRSSGAHSPLNFYASSSNYTATVVGSDGNISMRSSHAGSAFVVAIYTKSTD